jgi:hypothetical protein
VEVSAGVKLGQVLSVVVRDCQVLQSVVRRRKLLSANAFY